MLNTKKLRITIFITSALVILILILISVLVHYKQVSKLLYSAAMPPNNIKDLNSYLRWKPETKTIFKVENNETIYYLCLDKPGHFLPSGPSAYCFDSSFNFVGWTSDIGDLQGSLPRQAYERRYKWAELKIEEVTSKKTRKN